MFTSSGSSAECPRDVRADTRDVHGREQLSFARRKPARHGRCSRAAESDRQRSDGQAHGRSYGS
jgi:hypothetical protein